MKKKKVCSRANCDGCDVKFCAYCRYWHVKEVHVNPTATGKTMTLASGVCRAPIRRRMTDWVIAADENCYAFALAPERLDMDFTCRKAIGETKA